LSQKEPVNILLVDDQPAKLLTYEVILSELGENLIKAESAREALEYLLKNDIAIILTDVVMPDLDGFELAAMIRAHPRFQKIAIMFVSALALSDIDRVKACEHGAVDYVPIPVVPELLRAKVRVFAEFYRKARQLEVLNAELERRVEERTAELEPMPMPSSGSASKSTGSNARPGWCRCSTRCKTWRTRGSWP
jgi:CheY-like chemotaxis protein